MRNKLRKHTNSAKDWTKHHWDFFDFRISSKKTLILFCSLFNEFFILVELFKVIHCGHINSQVVSNDFIRMFLISYDTDFHFSDGMFGSLTEPTILLSF